MTNGNALIENDGEYIRTLETLVFQQRKLMQQALGVLEKFSEASDCDIDPFTFGRYGGDMTISALRQALAATTQPSDAQPVAREPLSEAEAWAIYCDAHEQKRRGWLSMTRAIEAAHGIHPTSDKGST